MAKNLNLVFKGIGTFHIAYFKDVESNNYYGSTEHTFSESATEKEVFDFFIGKNLHLHFKWLGTKFDCEPEGGEIHYTTYITLSLKENLKK